MEGSLEKTLDVRCLSSYWPGGRVEAHDGRLDVFNTAGTRAISLNIGAPTNLMVLSKVRVLPTSDGPKGPFVVIGQDNHKLRIFCLFWLKARESITGFMGDFPLEEAGEIADATSLVAIHKKSGFTLALGGQIGGFGSIRLVPLGKEQMGDMGTPSIRQLVLSTKGDVVASAGCYIGGQHHMLVATQAGDNTVISMVNPANLNLAKDLHCDFRVSSMVVSASYLVIGGNDHTLRYIDLDKWVSSEDPRCSTVLIQGFRGKLCAGASTSVWIEVDGRWKELVRDKAGHFLTRGFDTPSPFIADRDWKGPVPASFCLGSGNVYVGPEGLIFRNREGKPIYSYFPPQGSCFDHAQVLPFQGNTDAQAVIVRVQGGATWLVVVSDTDQDISAYRRPVSLDLENVHGFTRFKGEDLLVYAKGGEGGSTIHYVPLTTGSVDLTGPVKKVDGVVRSISSVEHADEVWIALLVDQGEKSSLVLFDLQGRQVSFHFGYKARSIVFLKRYLLVVRDGGLAIVSHDQWKQGRLKGSTITGPLFDGFAVNEMGRLLLSCKEVSPSAVDAVGQALRKQGVTLGPVSLISTRRDHTSVQAMKISDSVKELDIPSLREILGHVKDEEALSAWLTALSPHQLAGLIEEDSDKALQQRIIKAYTWMVSEELGMLSALKGSPRALANVIFQLNPADQVTVLNALGSLYTAHEMLQVLFVDNTGEGKLVGHLLATNPKALEIVGGYRWLQPLHGFWSDTLSRGEIVSLPQQRMGYALLSVRARDRQSDGPAWLHETAMQSVKVEHVIGAIEEIEDRELQNELISSLIDHVKTDTLLDILYQLHSQASHITVSPERLRGALAESKLLNMSRWIRSGDSRDLAATQSVVAQVLLALREDDEAVNKQIKLFSADRHLRLLIGVHEIMASRSECREWADTTVFPRIMEMFDIQKHWNEIATFSHDQLALFFDARGSQIVKALEKDSWGDVELALIQAQNLQRFAVAMQLMSERKELQASAEKALLILSRQDRLVWRQAVVTALGLLGDEWRTKCSDLFHNSINLKLAVEMYSSEQLRSLFEKGSPSLLGFIAKESIMSREHGWLVNISVSEQERWMVGTKVIAALTPERFSSLVGFWEKTKEFRSFFDWARSMLLYGQIDPSNREKYIHLVDRDSVITTGDKRLLREAFARIAIGDPRGALAFASRCRAQLKLPPFAERMEGDLVFYLEEQRIEEIRKIISSHLDGEIAISQADLVPMVPWILPTLGLEQLPSLFEAVPLESVLEWAVAHNEQREKVFGAAQTFAQGQHKDLVAQVASYIEGEGDYDLLAEKLVHHKSNLRSLIAHGVDVKELIEVFDQEGGLNSQLKAKRMALGCDDGFTIREDFQKQKGGGSRPEWMIRFEAMRLFLEARGLSPEEMVAQDLGIDEVYSLLFPLSLQASFRDEKQVNAYLEKLFRQHSIDDAASFFHQWPIREAGLAAYLENAKVKLKHSLIEVAWRLFDSKTPTFKTAKDVETFLGRFFKEKSIEGSEEIGDFLNPSKESIRG